MKTLVHKGLVALVSVAPLCGIALAAHAQEPPQQAVGRGGFAGMQRVSGTVTAVAGDTISVKGEDGTVYQIATTPNTRVMKGMGMPGKLAEMKVGDAVMAAGNMDDAKKTLHAVFVVAQDAEQVKKLRENLGKTYIVGRVTSIDADNLKMTVKRQDGVEQTIGFDETTSFKRGRGRGNMIIMGGPGGAGMSGGAPAAGGSEAESITLADVKVGDNVSGTGTVKSGTFVPTQLMVATPRGPREGRPANGATPPAGPKQ